MKKSTKILIAIAFLMTAISLNAQCNVVCHQRKTVKTLNDNALQGHLTHGDVYIASCEDFTGTIGDDCNTLSLPKLDFKTPIETGLFYRIYDISGRIYRMGKTDEHFIRNLPKGGVLFIKVEGYQAKKIIVIHRL